MHLQENTLYDLDLIVKVTQNVVQCPPNHMTYAPAKFEVAMSDTVFTNTFQTLPDIRSGAVMNFTRPNKILQDRKKTLNMLNA